MESYGKSLAKGQGGEGCPPNMGEYRVGSGGGGATSEGVGRKSGEKIKTGKRPPDKREAGGNPVVGEKKR